MKSNPGKQPQPQGAFVPPQERLNQKLPVILIFKFGVNLVSWQTPPHPTAKKLRLFERRATRLAYFQSIVSVDIPL